MTTTETTTRIRNLTYDNLRALHAIEADLPPFARGATFAKFEADAETVLRFLKAEMTNILRTRGGRDHTYRSLIAVRNKLLDGRYVQTTTYNGDDE